VAPQATSFGEGFRSSVVEFNLILMSCVTVRWVMRERTGNPTLITDLREVDGKEFGDYATVV
jgi:hypothetical protein